MFKKLFKAMNTWATEFHTKLKIYKKSKLHPVTEGGVGLGVGKMCSSTLYEISALDGVGGQWYSPAALPPWKRPGTHCT
jgi:hypothetical protein